MWNILLNYEEMINEINKFRRQEWKRVGFSFNDEHLKTIIDRALENPTLTLIIFAYDENSLNSYKEKFENVNNVRILYAASVDEENNCNYKSLTLDIADSFLEELYNAIRWFT